MKKTLIIISCLAFFGCSSNNDENEQETKIEQEEIPNFETLPQFESLKDMLADASDFYEENGSLKFISNDENNIHIQVSKPILDSDSETLKEEIVKRDIVYVAFQTFAQTNIKQLTITSVPNSTDSPNSYIEKYKKTVTIDRIKAKSILGKYLNTEDFSELYEQNGTLWLPNDKFSKLKFKHLDSVFGEMSNK